jgi:hypothetical protein
MNNRKYRMKGAGNADVVLEVTRIDPRDNGSWMVCWDNGHGERRAHITSQLPICNSEAACQRALDQFAAKRKLEEVKPANEAPHGATTNGDARTRILTLLAEINEVFEECSDLTIAEQVELSIDMAEQAITRLGDATEDATSDEDAETIKRSFAACEKMTQELEDITQI